MSMIKIKDCSEYNDWKVVRQQEFNKEKKNL
jgi:hypothetical protein